MRILILLLTILFSQNMMASTLKLNYSVFFGYMKTMYKLDYQHVTTDFYLIKQATGEQCSITNAQMVVDEKREQIDFEKIGKLMPFYSDEHRKDGAVIEVNTLDDDVCALQVTLTAKASELTRLSFERLVTISTELEGVLRKNAGMIGKYFLPTYSGLRFKLETPLASSSSLPEGYQFASNGDLLVSNETLGKQKGSQLLPFKVSRISPWIGD